MPTEIPKSATLTTRDPISLTLLLRTMSLAAEIYPLAPLPRFDTQEKQHRLDKHNTPFPGDTRVLEDTVVDDGDVQNGERKHEASHDPAEEEAVAPDVVHPLREVALRVRLHAEEAAPQVDHLPRQEEREPRHAGEGCCARPEHRVAVVAQRWVVVLCVAALRQVPVAPAEHHQCEG